MTTEPKDALVERLTSLQEANAARFDTLRHNQIGLDMVAQVMVALQTLLDRLFGPFKPENPRATHFDRLNYEIAFESKMGEALDDIIGQADRLRMEAEAKANQTRLFVPPAGGAIPDLKVVQ